MLTFNAGRQGCGKSLLLAYAAWWYYCSGWECETYHLNLKFPHTEINFLEALYDNKSRIWTESNNVLFIDDADRLIDCRRGTTKLAEKMHTWITGVRKRKQVIFISPHGSLIPDLRYRSEADFLINPHGYNPLDDSLSFTISFYNERQTKKIWPISPIFQLYDSYQLLMPYEKTI